MLGVRQIKYLSPSSPSSSFLPAIIFGLSAKPASGKNKTHHLFQVFVGIVKSLCCLFFRFPFLLVLYMTHILPPAARGLFSRKPPPGPPKKLLINFFITFPPGNPVQHSTGGAVVRLQDLRRTPVGSHLYYWWDLQHLSQPDHPDPGYHPGHQFHR